MKAAEKVHVLSQTPRDLAFQCLFETDNDGDLNWEARFVKLIRGPHRKMLDDTLIEYAQLVTDGKMPKVRKKSKPTETVSQDEIQRQLDAQAKRNAAAVQRILTGKKFAEFIVRINLAVFTLGDAYAKGGALRALGKRGSSKLFADAYPDAEKVLEKIGIGTA